MGWAARPDSAIPSVWMDRAASRAGFVGVDDSHGARHTSDDGAIRMAQYSYVSQSDPSSKTMVRHANEGERYARST